MPEKPVIACQYEAHGLCYAMVCFNRLNCAAVNKNGWPRYSAETEEITLRLTKGRKAN